MTCNPWMKFYPSDWRSDPKLKLVSMAARGLWIEMLCVMHEAATYGELTIGEVRLDATKLSRIVGDTPENVGRWLDELRGAGVFSIRKNGVIYSRRMERDENKRRKLRENGKKGGNPSLCKKGESHGLLIQAVKTSEARGQKPDNTPLTPQAGGETVAVSEKPKTRKPRTPKPPEQYTDGFLTFWNAFPPQLGGSKAQAFKNWWRAIHAGFSEQEILAGAKAYAEECRGREPRFIKRASNWISERLWQGHADATRQAEVAAVTLNGRTYTAQSIKRLVFETLTGIRSWPSGKLGPEPGKPGCAVPAELVAEVRTVIDERSRPKSEIIPFQPRMIA